MCVTVYYLNVSGLQSDRRANKKDNMFLDCLFLSLSYMCEDLLLFFFNVHKNILQRLELSWSLQKWSHYQNSSY